MTLSKKSLAVTAATFAPIFFSSCSSGNPSMPTSPSMPTAPTTPTAPMAAVPDVPTYHYNLNRDGLNAQETILTQANVNSTMFGKIGMDTVDGKVDAEPLYLADL